jgi:carbamoyl-phosphate synthase large subunit
MAKRTFDIIFSLLALALLSVPMVLIALAVRLGSRGGALFRQRRAGRRGCPFTMLKFRTMREGVDPYGVSPHSSADGRLTRLGRFLRRTSLDELPQLLNVLAGQMSLVGPRPLYERQAARWTPRQRRRLEVRPGLTGYAQVHGRGELTIEEKIELDLYYVEHASLWLDVKIILRTASRLLGGSRGVYERRYSRGSEFEPDGEPSASAAGNAPAAARSRPRAMHAAGAAQARRSAATAGGAPPASGELNVLFTCAGRRVALMEAFRRAADELGLAAAMLAADVTAAAPAFHRADRGIILPRADAPDYLDALMAAVREHRVGLIVPVTDFDLEGLASARGRFAALGCTVMIGSPAAIAVCRDKALTSDALAQAGLPTVRTLRLEAFRRSPFYPCFAKPARGSAGVGTAVLRSEADLAAHVAAFGEDLVFQEVVGGAEYTIDVYRSRDGRVRSAVPRQRLVVRSGEVEKAITVRDESLMSAAAAVAGAIDGLWGAFCCQCRREAGHPPRFFEVNPRFSGGAPLTIAAGADLPRYLLQEVLGRPVTAEWGRFTDGLLMARYDEAVFTRPEEPAALPGYRSPEFC